MELIPALLNDAGSAVHDAATLLRGRRRRWQRLGRNGGHHRNGHDQQEPRESNECASAQSHVAEAIG
jgi:hypothetical protein